MFCVSYGFALYSYDFEMFLICFVCRCWIISLSIDFPMVLHCLLMVMLCFWLIWVVCPCRILRFLTVFVWFGMDFLWFLQVFRWLELCPCQIFSFLWVFQQLCMVVLCVNMFRNWFASSALPGLWYYFGFPVLVYCFPMFLHAYWLMSIIIILQRIPAGLFCNAFNWFWSSTNHRFSYGYLWICMVVL